MVQRPRPLSIKERRLVELVVASGCSARADLARDSGMTEASVSRLISGLVELGILREEPDRQGKAGQPRRLLSIPSGAFFGAGLTFSLRRMEVALIDLAGNLIAREVVDITRRSARDVAEAAHACILQMRRRYAVGHDRLVGIGAAVPGNFGTFRELIRAHRFFLEFDEDRASRAFSSAFDVPVFIENDGSAAALGEYFFGRGEGDGDSIFFIHIGHGVGGGAVLDGRLFRGVHGNACLPGVLFPYGRPRPSGQDLFEYLARHGILIDDFDALAALPAAARHHVDAWVQRAATQLRHAARVATGFFDPSIVIIGGRLPAAVNARLVASILAQPIEGPSRGLPAAPVRASELGPLAGAIGAACIPLFATFFSGSAWDAGSPYPNALPERTAPRRQTGRRDGDGPPRPSSPPAWRRDEPGGSTRFQLADSGPSEPPD